MGVDWRKEEILPLGLYCIVTRPGLIISCVWSTDIITIIIISLQCIDDIMCLVDRRGWQRHQRTLGNAYTHNDRSSSRLSGLYLWSCFLVHLNCYLHGSKREAIYIHNCNFRGPNTSGGNHQSLLTEDSEHTRTGLRPDKMMIFHLVDRRILFVYRKNGNWCISS